MQQFQQQMIMGTKSIARMILVDCKVDLLFILFALALAFLATYVVGLIMATAELSQEARMDIAYLVPIFTLSSLFALAACRSSETFRQKPISKSNLFAILLGLGLLASRSAWNGFNPIAFNFTVSGTLLIITVCILAPICEEFFFRGYIWSKLVKRGYAAVLIIITTSLLYVLPHIPSSFVAFADYATIGLFLAAIRYLSGGIALPILFHVAMNSMVMLKL